MRIFKIGFFVIANILFVFLSNFILLKPSILKMKIQEISEANKKNEPYDFIMMGQSLIAAGMDPEIVDKKLGVNSYNCAIGMEQITTLNYLLEEIANTDKIKTIVLGLNATYWTGADSDGYGTGVFEFATNFRTKIKYFFNYFIYKPFTYLSMCDLNSSTLLNIPIYLKIKTDKLYRYPNDETLEWANIVLADNDRQTHNCYIFKPRGFNYGIELRPESNAYYRPLIFSDNDVHEDKIASFVTFVENCKKRNINLICTSSAMSPHRLREENYSEVHDYFKSLCEQNHVPYYDMTYAKDLKDRTDNDYLDWDGHMMGPMAENQTELLCDVLQSENPEEFFFTNYSELLQAMKVVSGEVTEK